MKRSFIAAYARTFIFCLFLLIVLAKDCGSTDTETQAQAARRYANCAEWVEAIESYNKALEASPRDAVCLARRGFAYAKSGNITQALTDLDSAIEYDTNCADAYSRRAIVYANLGLKRLAQQDAKEALRLVPVVPKEPDFLLEHAGLLCILERNKLADEESRQVIKLLSKRKDLEAYLLTGYAYHNLRQHLGAILCFDKAIDLAPTNANIHFLRGASHWHRQDWEKALTDFNLYLLHGNKNNPLALWAKGTALDSTGEFSKAIVELSQSIKLCPNFAFGFYSRGVAKHHLCDVGDSNDFRESIDDFTTAIALNSTESTWYTERAIVYSHQNEYERALKDAQIAVSLDPTEASAYKALGSAQSALKHFEVAVNSLTKAIDLAPEAPAGYYFSRGHCYRDSNQFKKAIADYTEAIKYEPQNALNYCARGCALVRDHQYLRAIEDCNESLKLSPLRTHPRLSRGIANARLGKYKTALQDFDNILSRNPSDGNAFYERSWVYRKLGKMTQYKSDLSKAKALGYESFN